MRSPRKIQSNLSLIHISQIISETEIQEDVINLGSVVQVHDFAFDEDIEYYIVGSNEANPLLGRISDLSPIGYEMCIRDRLKNG